MKPNPFIKFAAGLAVALIVPAQAIEAPVDDSPPPPPAAEAAPLLPEAAAPEKPAEAAPEAKAPEKQPDIAYLGVVSQAIPDVLAEHLGLEPGDGIVVESVMPDGPAAKAGIQENDVITHVAGKAVGNIVDLTREVKQHKPGDAIKVSVIQKGTPADIDVTLGIRPKELVEANPLRPDQLNLEGIPMELADRVREAIQGNLDLKFEIPDRGIQLENMDGEMQEEMKAMRKRMQEALQGLNGAQGVIPRINVEQAATIRLMDDKGSVELKSNEGGKEVTIRDKENNLTWTGPWDTDQDKAAAPDDVRERVERLNIDTKFQGNGLRLQMGGAGRFNLDPE